MINSLKNAAQAVGQGEGGDGRLRRRRADRARLRRGHGFLRLRPPEIVPVELGGKITPLSAQDGTGRAGEEDALRFSHPVPAE